MSARSLEFDLCKRVGEQKEFSQRGFLLERIRLISLSHWFPQDACYQCLNSVLKAEVVFKGLKLERVFPSLLALLSLPGSLQKESKKSSLCKENYPSKCNVLFRAASLHHLQPPPLLKKIWISVLKLKYNFMTLWAATALLTLCWFSLLAQVRAAMPDWVYLYAELRCFDRHSSSGWGRGGGGSEFTFPLVDRLNFTSRFKKGMFSGRDEGKVQAASACEESYAWGNFKMQNRKIFQGRSD